ncbi:response regulator transcription factor [Ruminiclostridium cellobioparum]|uniref:response regulator transcription factor n=1 Tax=Ruminiclostridium cellobioparum TaxID=29355 RepID=UPI0028AA0330|nr:response regulator [Ruminiclostridium cellobioparum]
MIKMLIVEDEKWEREGLIDYLNWKELGIEIVGAAANGVQGLKSARKYYPDLVITDIKMPLMDGIEFAREVGQFLPHCKFIFITGYDDFKYAKEAIRLGAYEYLLKPVQKHHLVNAVTMTTQKIYEQRNQSKYISSLKHQLSESLYEERERFLISLIEDEQKGQVDFGIIGLSELTTGSYGFLAAILRFDFVSSFHGKGYSEKRIYQKELFRRISRTIGNEGIVARNNNETNELIICIINSVYDRMYNQDTIRRISLKCREANMPEAVVGVGAFVKIPQCFVDSFTQAKSALEHIFFKRDQEILFYEDICEMSGVNGPDTYALYSYAAEYSKKVLNGIVSMDSKGISTVADELFDMIEGQTVDKSAVCNLIAGLVGEISTLLFSYDISFTHRLISEDIVATLKEFIKLEHMKDWFKELLEHANRCIYDKKNNKEENIVSKVMEIINNEYNSSIGAETIAHKLELSPNYLGALFKKYTGKSFTETLTDIRMKKAEELLISGYETLNYIAESTGYINTSHFCKVFKKRYGVSPMDYRKRHQIT